MDIDVLTCSESWLHEGVEDCCLSIENYNFFRQDRCLNRLSKKGGGLITYIKNSYQVDDSKLAHLNISNSNLEAQLLIIKKYNNKTTIIVNLYRSPSGIQSEFLEHIQNLTQAFQGDNTQDIYLTGDVNVDHLSSHPSETTSSLSTILKLYGLVQFIKEPTRVTATTKTILDVMYIKTSKSIKPLVCKIALSDHYLISCTRYLDYHKPQFQCITGRTYKDYTYEKAESFYRRQRLDLIYQIDVNLAWETILKYIYNSANSLCPFKKIRVHQDPSAWITSDIIEQLSDRDKAFELAYQTKYTTDLEAAKSLRTDVKRLMCNAKADFIQNNLRENSDDPKKFWGTQ